MCSKYLARSNSAPNFSIVSLCIMQLWEYIFPIDLPLYVPKKGFWGFWKWRCENALFWPPKGTTLCEYASVGVFCVKIGSTACRGVYTIESLKQMLQKNFRGEIWRRTRGDVFEKNSCRLAAVIFSGFSDKQIVRAMFIKAAEHARCALCTQCMWW